MRKIFTYLACASMAVLSALSADAASSKLYIIGQPAGGWAANKGTELTQKEPGVFTYSASFTSATYFAFADELGSSANDWNTLNAHRYNPTSNNAVPSGTENTIVYGGQDRSWMLPAGDYDMTIDTNTMNLSMGGGEIVIEIGDLYLRGDMNGWKAEAAWKFTKSGDVYTLADVTIPAGDKFKVGNADWTFDCAVPYADLSNIQMNKVYTYDKGMENNNMSFASEAKVTIIVNTKDETIHFKGETGPIQYIETLYLIGEPAGGWAANVGEKLEGSEGIFTYSADFAKQTYFGFATELGATANDWDTLNANRYGSNQTVGEADSYDIVEAGTYTMQKPNGNSWNLPAGKWTLTVNTVENTLVVTGQGDLPPVPQVPETLYIIGNIDDNDCNPTTPIEMTKIGNTFTVEAEAVANADGDSFFSFCSAKGSTNDEAGWGELSGSDRYGAATEGAVATVGTPFAYTVYKANVDASACKSWSIAPNTDGHKYKFTVDFDKQTVTVTMTSGVDSIEVENDGEAVYFNLQGVRVDNPENGIFVRVANGKAVKVVK